MADFRAQVSPVEGLAKPGLGTWLAGSAPDPVVGEDWWPLEVAPCLGDGFAPHYGPLAHAPVLHPALGYSLEFTGIDQVIFLMEPPEAAPDLPKAGKVKARWDPAPPPPAEGWMAISAPEAAAAGAPAIPVPQPAAPQGVSMEGLGMDLAAPALTAAGRISFPASVAAGVGTAAKSGEALPTGLEPRGLSLPALGLAAAQTAGLAMLADAASQMAAPAARDVTPAAKTQAAELACRPTLLPQCLLAPREPALAKVESSRPGGTPAPLAQEARPAGLSGALVAAAMASEYPPARLPGFGMAVIETDLFDVVPEPARCQQATPIPAQPAARELRAASSEALASGAGYQCPLFPEFAAGVLGLPEASEWQLPPMAQPALETVSPQWDARYREPAPRMAAAQFRSALPKLGPTGGLPSGTAAEHAPLPLELLVEVAAAANPCSFAARKIRLQGGLLDSGGLAATERVPTGLRQALDPQPVEAPFTSAVAVARIGWVQDLCLPPFELSASRGFSIAGFGDSQAEAAPPEPQELNAKPAVLVPISWIRVQAPVTPDGRHTARVPKPGFIPVEFYCQRAALSRESRVEWKTPEIPLVLPRFGFKIAAERTEEILPPKPEPKPASATEVFSLPGADKRWRPSRAERRFAQIAACLLVGLWLWFGSQVIQIGNPIESVDRAFSQSAERPSGEAGQTADAAGGRAPGPPTTAAASQSALQRVRHAVADRAATELTDNFRNGMEAWGSATMSWAPGWTRHPDGYTRPGQLALFRPTMTYTDYRLEFFGQIEDKGLGMVVRAQDSQNYYAMKVKMVQTGLRPVIAMVHYPVVDGRKGHAVETPLSVMVHRNLPFHMEVDVRGNRLTALVEGQKVDSWTDDVAARGGVGFFSEAGEHARLYWMRVLRNQDWLGVVCSFLAGDAPAQTAEIWRPGMPADRPQPAPPAHTDEIMLAEEPSGPSCEGIHNQGRFGRWS